jgi:sulfur carrier protein
MMLFVNGHAFDTAARALDGLVQELDHEAQSVATAVNGDFVPRSARAATALKDGDRIEILAPMQGG